MIWRNRTSVVLACCAACLALLSLIGWHFQVDLLIRWSDRWATVHVVTAVALLLQAFSLMLVVSGCRRLWKDIAISTIEVCSVLLVLLVLWADNLNMETSYGGWLAWDPELPSHKTIIEFLILGYIGFRHCFSDLPYDYRKAGKLVMVLGVVGMVGYVADLPVLYGYLVARSGAQAFPTALAITLLGLGYAIGEHRSSCPFAIHCQEVECPARTCKLKKSSPPPEEDTSA